MYEAMLIKGWEADHFRENNSIQNSRGMIPPTNSRGDAPRDRSPLMGITDIRQADVSK